MIFFVVDVSIDDRLRREPLAGILDIVARLAVPHERHSVTALQGGSLGQNRNSLIPGWKPAVAGPGDRHRVNMPNRIRTVKGHWNARAEANLEVMETTQRLLHTNVQEALALEVGLLKLRL